LLLILHSSSRCLHLRQPDQEEVVPRMTMMAPYTGAQNAVDSFHCHSSRLRVIGSLQPVICAGLVFKLLFSSTIIFLTLLQENQRRRRQQRRGLGASAVSEHFAEDANLLSVPNLPRRNVTHGVMSERYHLGGRVETDTVAMAAARQDQAGIQRRHRLERRRVWLCLHVTFACDFCK
jgi:hypothetical protein